MRLTKKYLDELSYQIIGAAIEVHKEFGPGLLEKVYEKCLKYELEQRNLKVEAQGKVPILYKGKDLSTNMYYDLLVEGTILVELKAVEQILPIHQAQLLSHMKLLKVAKGLLLNFNCLNIFREGQKTMVNDFYKVLPEK